MSFPVVPLGDIATIIMGQSPPSNTYNEYGVGLPFFQGKTDFGENHPTVRKWCVAPNKIAESGDILISVRAPVGPTNVADTKCCVGRGLAAVRPNETLALRDFVLWSLKHHQTDLIELGQGSTFVAIGKETLKSLQIPLPTLDEQRRIVDILNRAAKIERLRRQAQERLQEFIPALFIKMFGDPVENPMGWDVAELRALGSLDRGRSQHRPRNAHELYGGPYPFIQTGDIANSNGVIQSVSQTYSEIGLRQSKLWPAGTLCITIAANIGKTGVLSFDACFPDSVVGFTPRKSIIVEYVQTALDLMQKRIEETAPMAAQRNINLKSLGNLRIPVPSLIHQERFVEIVRPVNSTFTHGIHGSSVGEKLTGSLLCRFLGAGA